MWIKVAFQEMAPRSPIDITRLSVQAGDVMYWQSIFNKILAFHVNSREVHEIPVPVDIRGDDYDARLNTLVVVPKDSSLGFVYITLHDLQLWVSNFINGVHVEWMPLRAVRLNNFLPLRDASRTLAMWTAQRAQVRMIGYDEDENVVYLWTKVGVFGLQLDRMQSHKLLDYCGWMQTVYPYKSFFITPGGDILKALFLHAIYFVFRHILLIYHKWLPIRGTNKMFHVL